MYVFFFTHKYRLPRNVPCFSGYHHSLIAVYAHIRAYFDSLYGHIEYDMWSCAVDKQKCQTFNYIPHTHTHFSSSKWFCPVSPSLDFHPFYFLNLVTVCWIFVNASQFIFFFGVECSFQLDSLEFMRTVSRRLICFCVSLQKRPLSCPSKCPCLTIFFENKH